MTTNISETAQSKIIQIIAKELSVGPHQVAAAVALLDEGATVPFIAAARMLASHFGIGSAALHLLLGTAAGLTGPLVALGVMNRMGLSRIAGFGDSRWVTQRYAGRS
jgi:hypothetical protein